MPIDFNKYSYDYKHKRLEYDFSFPINVQKFESSLGKHEFYNTCAKDSED